MAYTPTVWVGGAAPGIAASLLNHLETQYQTALDDIPEDAAAGVASERTLGNGALQAAPGDHGHDFADYVATNETGFGSISGADFDLEINGGLANRYNVGTEAVTTATFTTTSRVAALHVMAYAIKTGNGTSKFSLEVDGVEQVALTVASGNQRGNIHLLGLGVKNSADIEFKVKLTNNSTDTAVDFSIADEGNATTSHGTTATDSVDARAKLVVGTLGAV